MRNAFARALAECAKADPRIHLVVADISPDSSTADFPVEQFVNVGVAEQTMIGMCAGMALKGKRPFAYTIAPFALYRPFEFIRDDLCYQNLPVTVVGMGAGLTYSTLGGTHQAIEDIAVACALPNMQVIAPCDPQECAEAVRWCATQNDGPVYLRIGKTGEVNLDGDEPWEFGKLRYLKRAPSWAPCVIGYGPIIGAIHPAEWGDYHSLICCHTLKPLDIDGIRTVLNTYGRVCVVEEQVPQGGLAAQIKQIAWDMGADCRIETITLKDEFIHCYGSRKNMLRTHGIQIPD